MVRSRRALQLMLLWLMVLVGHLVLHPPHLCAQGVPDDDDCLVCHVAMAAEESDCREPEPVVETPVVVRPCDAPRPMAVVRVLSTAPKHGPPFSAS